MILISELEKLVRDFYKSPDESEYPVWYHGEPYILRISMPTRMGPGHVLIQPRDLSLPFKSIAEVTIMDNVMSLSTNPDIAEANKDMKVELNSLSWVPPVQGWDEDPFDLGRAAL